MPLLAMSPFSFLFVWPPIRVVTAYIPCSPCAILGALGSWAHLGRFGGAGLGSTSGRGNSIGNEGRPNTNRTFCQHMGGEILLAMRDVSARTVFLCTYGRETYIGHEGRLHQKKYLLCTYGRRDSIDNEGRLS